MGRKQSSPHQQVTTAGQINNNIVIEVVVKVHSNEIIILLSTYHHRYNTFGINLRNLQGAQKGIKKKVCDQYFSSQPYPD